MRPIDLLIEKRKKVDLLIKIVQRIKVKDEQIVIEYINNLDVAGLRRWLREQKPTVDYDIMTTRQLRMIARSHGVPNYSNLCKHDLIQACRSFENDAVRTEEVAC